MYREDIPNCQVCDSIGGYATALIDKVTPSTFVATTSAGWSGLRKVSTEGIAPTPAHAPGLGSILTSDRATDATVTWKQWEGWTVVDAGNI